LTLALDKRMDFSDTARSTSGNSIIMRGYLRRITPHKIGGVQKIKHHLYLSINCVILPFHEPSDGRFSDGCLMRKSKIDPALIQELIDQGRSDLEIANRLGCTVGTLRVRCSQLKLSLRRPAKVVLPQAILDQLNQRAELMGVSTTTLAADLLEEIARDDLYDAVLDRDDTKVNPIHAVKLF
jgi:hypothetical protein